MENKKEQLEKELNQLIQEGGYDNIRLFVAPDKNILYEDTLEDIIAYLKAKKTGKGMTTLFTVK